MTGHRDDVERLMPLFAVTVLCSDKAEGVPQAMLQALACSRPVVAADAGDVAEVVQDGRTGLLVPAGTAEPLTGAVLRLLADPGLGERLGRAGRELVLARHSREAMLLATEAAYRAAGVPPAGRAA